MSGLNPILIQRDRDTTNQSVSHTNTAGKSRSYTRWWLAPGKSGELYSTFRLKTANFYIDFA